MHHSLSWDSHACLGCRYPTCMTIILFYLHLLFVEKHTCLVLTEMFLRLVLMPGNLKEENKFILAKVKTQLAYTNTRKCRPKACVAQVSYSKCQASSKALLACGSGSPPQECLNSRMQLLRVGSRPEMSVALLNSRFICIFLTF